MMFYEPMMKLVRFSYLKRLFVDLASFVNLKRGFLHNEKEKFLRMDQINLGDQF